MSIIKSIEKWVSEIKLPPVGLVKEITLQITIKDLHEITKEVREQYTFTLEETRLSAVGITINLKVV